MSREVGPLLSVRRCDTSMHPCTPPGERGAGEGAHAGLCRMRMYPHPHVGPRPALCLVLPPWVPQVPVYGHLVCNGCSIMLMYPVGAQSVKCSVCHYVTPVTATSAGPSASLPARPRPATQTVVVENPSTLDDQGNEVRRSGLGRGVVAAALACMLLPELPANMRALPEPWCTHAGGQHRRRGEIRQQPLVMTRALQDDRPRQPDALPGVNIVACCTAVPQDLLHLRW